MRFRPTLYFEEKHAEIYISALNNAILADINAPLTTPSIV